MIGIGYQESRIQQKEKGKNESKGNEEFLLYFGRAHLYDETTKVEARSLLKIGRGKYKTAIMRGRNQSGIDFRVYAEIIVSNNDETHMIEKIVKKLLKNKNVKGSQGQRELYQISDDELSNTVDMIVSAAKKDSINILEVNFYIKTQTNS
jgi:hypothetical protein